MTPNDGPNRRAPFVRRLLTRRAVVRKLDEMLTGRRKYPDPAAQDDERRLTLSLTPAGGLGEDAIAAQTVDDLRRVWREASEKAVLDELVHGHFGTLALRTLLAERAAQLAGTEPAK